VDLVRLFSNPDGSLVELRGDAGHRGGKPVMRVRPPRQVQRRLIQDEVDRLVDEYLVGATISDLASRFGVHERTVSAHLERGGVGRRYRLLDDTAVEVAAGLYSEGWSLARVGQHFGVQAGTVLRALRLAGVPTRPRVGRS
jgi:DNA-binding transcriptional ArsR family regulator